MKINNITIAIFAVSLISFIGILAFLTYYDKPVDAIIAFTVGAILPSIPGFVAANRAGVAVQQTNGNMSRLLAQNERLSEILRAQGYDVPNGTYDSDAPENH